MNEPEANFEKNLERLLPASCGPETRVSPAVRERFGRQLAAMLPARPRPAEFPGALLAALTGLMLLFCATWGVAAWPSGAGLLRNFPTVLILVLVVVNVMGLPVASLIIVLRRKYV
jgi:hypothetical protein